MSVFLFKDLATTEIYTYGHTLSLHAALPIAPVVVVTLAAGQVELTLPPLKGRVTGIEERLSPPVDGDVDRQATRLARDVSGERSEEHTSELQSLMRISYAVFCLKKKKQTLNTQLTTPQK